MENNLITKITVKTVYGKVDRAELYKDGSSGIVPIMRVGGIGTGTKAGASDYGEFCKVTGQFQAINAKTGEIFVAGTLILPNVVNNLIVGAVQPGQSAAFLFDIFAKRDDDSATGYTYGAKAVVDTNEEDPVKKLFASAGEYQPLALAAPTANGDKKEETAEDAPATKAKK